MGLVKLQAKKYICLCKEEYLRMEAVNIAIKLQARNLHILVQIIVS